ncbi:cytochrome c-type biogenesis protein CcmE [Archangium gephyra]|uniref:Cytochrome c-type biogenesis protein CcmE n=1 Tax=Archangium gephyra TaxID=48 RepID=A0AAC8Q8W8_9BACT|nr:cytochrome c maturation protein CcmE [Archangium gephyra]AKJ03019.1 Cytochrome c-type biogenesis protein CcmE, heme chaperone [Archangium gephyra]REG25140.1 cytochrome c-type biogenesis protein CcmE [Archangium gephyra]
MTQQTRNRLIAVVSLLVAGAGLSLVAFGNIGENLVYYWRPSEMMAQGEKAYGPTIRLGGQVQPGSIQWNEQHTTLQFRVMDDEQPGAAHVLVRTTEVPPQMFRERIGVVVEGTFDQSQVFQGSRLMVNHSNEYRAPKTDDDVKKMFEDMKKQEATTAAARTP